MDIVGIITREAPNKPTAYNKQLYEIIVLKFRFTLEAYRSQKLEPFEIPEKNTYDVEKFLIRNLKRN